MPVLARGRENWERIMFRKLALAAAAALTLGAGMAAAPAPASAEFLIRGGSGTTQSARHWGGHHGHGGHGHGYWRRPHDGFGFGFYGPPRPRRYCEEVVVRRKVRGEWRRYVETRCYPRRYRYY